MCGQDCWDLGLSTSCRRVGHPAAGTRVDIVTRVLSWYMEEEVARELTKEDWH